MSPTLVVVTLTDLLALCRWSAGSLRRLAVGNKLQGPSQSGTRALCAGRPAHRFDYKLASRHHAWIYWTTRPLTTCHLGRLPHLRREVLPSLHQLPSGYHRIIGVLSACSTMLSGRPENAGGDLPHTHLFVETPDAVPIYARSSSDGNVPSEWMCKRKPALLCEDRMASCRFA